MRMFVLCIAIAIAGAAFGAGVWRVAQIDGVGSLEEVERKVKDAEKSNPSALTVKTYPVITFDNAAGNWGDFKSSRSQFPGTDWRQDRNWFGVIANTKILVPAAGWWTFAYDIDNWAKVTIKGRGLSV